MQLLNNENFQEGYQLNMPRKDWDDLPGHIDQEINKWKENFTDGTILRSHYNSLKELEDDWAKYMDQCYQHKLIANNMAYRLYGMKNEEIYYKLKTWFLTHDIIQDKSDAIKVIRPTQKIINESLIQLVPNQYDNFRNSFPTFDPDNRAKDITRREGYYILTNDNILDMDDLNQRMYKFRSMPEDKRNKSDTYSIQLYGKKNEERYNEMMPKYLAQDTSFQSDPSKVIYDYDSTISYRPSRAYLEHRMDTSNIFIYNRLAEFAETTLNSIDEGVILVTDILKTRPPESIVEELVLDNIITNKLIRPYLDELEPEVRVQNAYFTPYEMKDIAANCTNPNKKGQMNSLGYSITPKEWFDSYEAYSLGLAPNKSNLTNWNYRDYICKMFEKIDSASTEEEKETLQEELIMYGWNPSITLTKENENMPQTSFLNRNKEIFANNLGYSIVDFTNRTDNSPNIPIEDIRNAQGLYVVFLSREDLEDINVPKIYVGLEPSLEVLIPLSMGKFTAKTSLNSIYKSIPNPVIDVYYLKFLPETFSKVRKMFDYFMAHGFDYRFKYSVFAASCTAFGRDLNISNKNLVCIYLMNMILSISNMNYMNPGSYMVLPTLANLMNDDKKDYIYKIYSGPLSSYQSNQVSQSITTTIDSSIITESFPKYNYLLPWTQVVPLREAKSLPVEFDQDGNLLIQQRQKIDFAAEYAKCHKLLQQYSKAKGYEAMKYYVAKLWYLNIMIEKRIYNPKKFDKETLTSYYNTRAHILSDFKKYMGEILEQEPNFDFQKYYKTTPFDRSVLKVSKNFMKTIWSFFKTLIKPI